MMEQEPGENHGLAEEPPDTAASAPTSGMGRGRADAGQPSSPGDTSSFWSVIFAAIASAVLGSVVLAVCEYAGVRVYASRLTPEESWPWDIVIAAAGRVIVTHVLFWIPVMGVCGLLYWLVARRRAATAPEPVLLAVFVLLAALVVMPADLEISRQLGGLFLIVGFVGGLGLAAAVYSLMCGIHRRMGTPRFQRLFRLAAGLGVVLTLVASLFLARSPFFNPGAHRVGGGRMRNPAHKHPHVLWIVLDTARADWLSVYGYEKPTSPFLEEWAKQAIVFDRAIGDGMWTLPTHASMFTGLPARAHGLGHAALRLDDSFRTVAEALGENGYQTGFFSNNIVVAPKTNLSQGFDTVLVVYHFQRSTRFSLPFLCEKWGITPPLPWLDLDYGAALTNELVARWLDAGDGSPVFVFINYMEAHLPFRTPRRYREMFMSDEQVHRSYDLRRRVYGKLEQWLNVDALIDGYDHMPPFDREVVKCQYGAALRYLDERVREMIDIFRQRGLLDNTLVVITSDHGEYLDTHGMWSHRFLAYQDVIHVPLLLREPGCTDSRRHRTLVQLSDLYPTVLRAALGASAAQTGPHARDLLAIAGEGDRQRIAISEYFGAELVVRPRLLAARDPKLRHYATRQIAAVDSRFKYLRSGDGRRELYDLVNDPGELENLEYSHWKEAQRLEDYIESWLRRVPVYEPKPHRDGAGPDRDVMDALKGLGYVGDDD